MSAARCTATLVLVSMAAHAVAARGAEGAPTAAEVCDDAFDKAQDFHKAGKLLAERAQLAICATDACDPAIKKRCEEWIVRADETTPTVVLVAREKGGGNLVTAKIWLDGAPLPSERDGRAIPVDPGAHKFLFKVDGKRDVEVDVVLEQGQKNREIGASFEPPQKPTPATPRTPVTPPPHGPPVGAFILGGIGLVALGSFTYFGLKGRKEIEDIRATGCAKYSTCDSGEVGSARRKLLIADISLGVGVLALAGSAWLFLRGGGENKPGAQLSVVPLTAGAFAGLDYRF